MNIPDFKHINNCKITEKYIKRHYPEFYQYLIGNYPSDLSFSEKIYWYAHKIKDYPVCQYCEENRVGYEGFFHGYRKFCSQKCVNNSPDKLERIKNIDHSRKAKKKNSTKKEPRPDVPELESLNCNTATEKSIKMFYPKFYELLMNNYPVDLKFTERIYWYYHGIVDYPCCEQCKVKRTRFDGFIRGYRTYCSIKCSNESETKREKVEQTNLERYGCKAPAQNEEIKKKTREICLEKYGVENPLQLPEFKLKNAETHMRLYGGFGMASEISRKKYEETCLEKYGTMYPSQTKEFKERTKNTCKERYGTIYFPQSQAFKDKVKEKYSTTYSKVYETKKKNGTFNTSSIEQELIRYFNEHNINFKYQYRSEEYPFNCDFYFPDKDTYLEIQGNWTHGSHPYNSNSLEDKNIVEKWKGKNTKFYELAIDVWTVRDVNKRNHVKEHNLNWIEIFSIDLNEIIDKLHNLNII